MKKRIEDLSVEENKQLNEEFYILRLHSQTPFDEIKPGQFAEVRIDGSPETFLRRPISVYDVDYTRNELSLLIKKAGKGTHHLAEIKKGKRLNLVYPLGNNFSDPEGPSVLLIGGGTGVAPMLILGRYLKERLQITPNFLLGYRKKELMIENEKFSDIGKVFLTTEDGSAGEKGYVIDHSVLHDQYPGFDHIYACGPEVMMKAVARYAADRDIMCEVSLENLMGCGIGACLCCIVDTVDRGNINTCTEGPVFNSKRLKWLI